MSDFSSDWLPIFPLNTVLFPDGILNLRVFEARYIDMVSQCMRDHVPFGIALIKSGNEIGGVATTEAIGCLARIIQWNRADPGVFMLRVQGDKRFRIIETRELMNHRLEAKIQILQEDGTTPPSDGHVRCATSLKNVINNLAQKTRIEKKNGFDPTFAFPIRLDHAGWVANRWCEILPISLKARQKLLELDDEQTRLQIVFEYLQQHQLL